MPPPDGAAGPAAGRPSLSEGDDPAQDAPGLDVRTEGGLVIAPGGRGVGGVYETTIDSPPAELPQWLAQIIVDSQNSPGREKLPPVTRRRQLRPRRRVPISGLSHR